MLTQYLVDTSALARIFRARDVRARWEQPITAGLVAICPVVELEFLYAARSKSERDELIELLRGAFVYTTMPEQVFERAEEIQGVLSTRGTHRAAGPVDLLVAATAELQNLVVLHYDRDFDTIAESTGRAAQWLAQPGSLP